MIYHTAFTDMQIHANFQTTSSCTRCTALEAKPAARKDREGERGQRKSVSGSDNEWRREWDERKSQGWKQKTSVMAPPHYTKVPMLARLWTRSGMQDVPFMCIYWWCNVIRFINIQVCINGRKSGEDYVFGKYITMFRWCNISMFNSLISVPLASNEMAKIMISFLNTICRWSVKQIVPPINAYDWVSQCCEADQDAQTLSVDNQPRMSDL